MYTTDPTIISAQFQTNPVVNTISVHNIAPAPGLGLRYRVVALSVSIAVTNEPIANIFQLRPLANGMNYWYFMLNLPNHGADGHNFEFPGIIHVVNGVLSIQSMCSAVSRFFNVTAHYYIDQLT